MASSPRIGRSALGVLAVASASVVFGCASLIGADFDEKSLGSVGSTSTGSSGGGGDGGAGTSSSTSATTSTVSSGTGGSGGSGCSAPFCPVWANHFLADGLSSESHTNALIREGTSVIATGYFNHKATFAPGAMVTAKGYYDFFAVRLLDDGTPQLVATYGGTGFVDQAVGVAGAAVGGGYWIAGTYFGSPMIGGAQLMGVGGFLAHFDPSLVDVAPLPQPSVQGVGEDAGLAADPVSLGFYLAISIQGTVDFGGGPLPASNAFDGYVAAFDASGDFRWATQLSGTGNQRANDVLVDADGTVVVAGAFENQLVVGAQSFPGSAAGDGFVVRLSAMDGQPLGVRLVTGASGERTARRLARVDDALYVAGDFSGESDISGTMETASAQRDAFVARIDPGLDTTWSVRVGGAGPLHRAVDVDATASAVTLVMTCPSQILFDARTILGGGGKNVCIARTTPGGQPLWAGSFGDNKDQEASSVLALADGAVVAGTLRGLMDLGEGTTLEAVNGPEGFAFRFRDGL